MFIKEPIKDGKLNFGKYNGVDLIKVFKEDRVYFEWCNTHIQGFEFPRESLFEIYKDAAFVDEFLISDDLAEVLEGDPVGDRILKLRNKKVIGNISAIKLSDKSDLIDMICYKEEGKKNWTISKAGKCISKIIKDNYLTSSAREIELFVNSFKARMFLSNCKFEVVSGKDIKKYYHYSTYMPGGTLNQSCMKGDGCQKFFKLYTKNEDAVKLVLLKENNSDKILGRAILWKNALINGEKTDFLDRIYYTNDFYINIFIQYAIKNKIAYKRDQSNNTESPVILKGNEINNPKIVVKLDDVKFEQMPYLDTLAYVWKNNYISNKEPWTSGMSEFNDVKTCTARSTSGEKTAYYNYSY
jgi:hypothetical protein